MALKVTVNHPDFPKGTEFDIVGLGAVENGSSLTLKEEDEKRFMAATEMTVKEGLVNEMFKVEGTSEVKGGVSAVVPSEVSTTPTTT